MNCDLLTVVEGISRLERKGFARPKIPKEATDLAKAYHEELSDLPTDCVAEGFTRYIRDGESSYWPRPGKIRQLAMAVRRERPAQAASDLNGKYLAWENRGWRDEQDGALTPCPVCGVIPQDVVSERSHRATRDPSALFRVPHDRQIHREKNVRALS